MPLNFKIDIRNLERMRVLMFFRCQKRLRLLTMTSPPTPAANDFSSQKKVTWAWHQRWPNQVTESPFFSAARSPIFSERPKQTLLETPGHSSETLTCMGSWMEER